MPNSENTTRLVALLERTARLVQGEMHAGALVPAQWQALSYLSRANRFSRAPGALAAYLGATKGTVSQTLLALERKGLLVKQPSPSDGRGVVLALTARGQRLLEAHPLTDLHEALEHMSEPERQALDHSLSSLLLGLLDRRDGRSFGQCRTCRHFVQDGAGAATGGPHRCGLLDIPLGEADAAQICLEHAA